MLLSIAVKYGNIYSISAQGSLLMTQRSIFFLRGVGGKAQEKQQVSKFQKESMIQCPSQTMQFHLLGNVKIHIPRHHPRTNPISISPYQKDGPTPPHNNL